MSDEIIQVEAMDSGKKNSRKIDSMGAEETVELGGDASRCHWNDAEFPEGSKVCDNGITYECQFGNWFKLEGDC